jgi:tripartite-type tricarboxylate transporter receptor subunit TctC
MPNLLKRALIAASIVVGGSVAAQTFPSKPIHLVVTAGPGSSADIVARFLGEELNKQLGQPVVVDNRPGAGGNIAAEVVAKSPPDGHTLLLASISTHGINPSLYGKLRFDPVADFAPITPVATSPNVLVVSASSQLKSIQQIIDEAKKHSRDLTFSSGGNGTSQHLAGEMFATMTGIKLLHVPYKSAPQSMNAVLAGEVDMSFVSAPVAWTQAQSKSITAIGVTSRQRLGMWPELKPIADQGLPGYDVSAWFGLVAPAGTPEAIVEKLHAATRKSLELPLMRARLQQQGFETMSGTPAQFRDFIRKEIERWAKVVRSSGAKAE